MRLALEQSDIEAIAARVAALLSSDAAPPWLNTEGAAAYMACPVSRIRKLTMTGDLPSYKEGGRRLYRRDELDRFIASGGGETH